MRRLIIPMLMAAVLVSPAIAETIFLKDGSRLTGRVIAASADSIRFETPDGVLMIRRDRIQKIDYGVSCQREWDTIKA